MSDYKPLDGTADVLPVGLQPTPFGEVWQALQQVAADVWNVDPSVYRAGMAWLWYAVNHPDDLASDSLRALLVAALISEQAPMVKDWQTNAELVEYLRVWRAYSPTYAKLEAIFATFGARVEVRPISDAESQGVVPVADRRLSFYLRVEEFDAARPLTLDEVYQIAVRATPLGSRPVPYFALVGSSDVFAGPASAGLVRALWASEPAEPVTPPTPAYTEITLYMQSGNKQAQKQVTSGFTGNANATYCYQLYVDEQLTTPWAGYDYSNNYELGGYSGGVWIPWTMTSVSSLPSTYTSDSTQWKMAYILMDNGFLWIASNASGSGYMSFPSGSITLRIYPKGETVFAMYPIKTSSMGIYDNKSISTGGQNMQWTRGTAGSTQGGVNFPTMLVNGVYKSGAIFDQSLVSRARVWSSGGNDSTIRASSTSSFSCNAITFTFEQPIYKAWFKADHTDKTDSTIGYLPTNTNHTLYDEVGNTIDFEDDCTYTPCLVFIASGNPNGNMYINASQSLVANGSNHLAYKYTNGTLSKACYVLYTKKYGIDIDVNFGDPVTIPEGYRVESVKCSKLFVKASNVTGDDVTREINFEYLGENLFCTDKNKTWFGAKVSPVIEMFGFSNPSTFGGFRLSCYTANNTGYAASVSASEFNSGGYFVKGKAILSSSYTASTYAGYMQTNPMMFRLYSGGNVLAEYHFTIQHSMWSFENGVFSWLGNDTDYADLAYWYKSAPNVRIHCVKI